MKILIDPGKISYNALKTSIGSFCEENELVVINADPGATDWARENSGLVTYSYSLLDRQENEISAEGLDVYGTVLELILADYRTLLTAERVHYIYSWHSQFYNVQRIEKQVFNAINFLLTTRPNRLIFQATPHHLRQWTLAKVAEFMDIPVHMIQTSPLPWRFWLVEGLDAQGVVANELINGTEISDEQEVFEGYLKKNSEDYSLAIPSYEKIRIDKRGGKFWSWKKEIFDAFKSPRNLIFLWQKRILYNLYSRLSNNVDFNQKYLIFFLHYQPERTSLPEGRFYSQQWLVVRALSMLLPYGWRLLVKEHPSIFTGKFDVRYRHPQFYKDLVSLKNVKLVPLDVDSFSLIDKSQAIVTLTGTVGVQSLIRGKPVVVFGVSSYRGAKGVYEINNLNDVKAAITAIENQEIQKLSDETKLYLSNSRQKSISGLTLENKNDVYAPNIRTIGHINLLNYIFKKGESFFK